MVRKMPLDIQDVFDLLVEDIKQNGAAERIAFCRNRRKLKNKFQIMEKSVNLSFF